MQKDILYKVSEISEHLGVSTTTTYKHIKRLQKQLSEHQIKEKGVNFFNQTGFNLISSSIKATISESDCKSLSTGFEVGLNSRLEGLEKAVMLLVESNKQLSDQNKTLAATIELQNRKLNLINWRLEPPRNREIEVWQPAPKKVPEYPYLKRFWYSLVKPEKLRAN